jgi:hypothetical protein
VQEGNQLAITFGFALIIIFLVLAAQFESLRDPLVIMISVPMAIVGALIPLFFGVATINIYTQVGLLTLVGLITKHGILMVEFANELQLKEGLDKRSAIEMAARIRLRPILMTTAAMVTGLIPLLTATGAGAASRFSIGLVVVAGMSIGTLFTLFVLPAVYVWIATDHQAKAESSGPRRSPISISGDGAQADLSRRVALHAARIGGGAAAAAVARGGGEAAFRPVGADLDDVAAALQLLSTVAFGTRFSTTSTPGRAVRGQNEIGKCSECQAGASIASCRFMPAWTWRRKNCVVH